MALIEIERVSNGWFVTELADDMAVERSSVANTARLLSMIVGQWAAATDLKTDSAAYICKDCNRPLWEPDCGGGT